MKIAAFILVIDSYVVRKGMLAVLNRIHGVRVLKEFSANEAFPGYLKNHQVDFMIIGQSEFDRSAELFIANPALLEKTILIMGSGEKTPAPPRPEKDMHTVIHLQEDRDSIIKKIQILLNALEQPGSESPATTLSPREITIVRMVSMGLTNRQIADRLFLSAHTVMTHRKNISSKLGIKSVSGLTIYAIVNNIITMEEVSSLAAK